METMDNIPSSALRVYDAILRYRAEHGYLPNTRQLSNYSGSDSARRIMQLVRLGIITRLPGHRGYEVNEQRYAELVNG